MMLHSPRWRAALICVVLVVATFLVRGFAERLAQWVQALSDRHCVDTFAEVRKTTALCVLLDSSIVVYRIVLVLLLLSVLAAAVMALGWAVQPIRDLAAEVGGLGPQNFGYRVRSGRRRGEMAVLAGAVNEMIGRVAVGYESQRRFAADASHELRTPLAVQRTLIEVSLARAPSPQKLKIVAEQLLDTNERNVRLIEALLTLSESDRGLASRTLLRLDAIVARVVAGHEARAAGAGVTISTILRPRPVLGEQVLLERLVTNLVENAIKYNRRGGSIEVRVADQPALTVTNTGDDIPADAVDGLFEPFRRLQATRIDHSGGVGLGLTIARSIVQAHEGTIAAHSSGRDGLRVQVALPAAGDG